MKPAVKPRTRFRSGRETLDDFMDEFLVVCPRCGKCAVLRPVESTQPAWSISGSFGTIAPIRSRVVCGACGYNRDGVVPYQFGLWLRARCCGHSLWAYNRRHLEFLENYVGAMLRETEPDPVLGWRNKSLSSRLPGWMKKSQNREKVLRAIQHLKRKGLPG